MRRQGASGVEGCSKVGGLLENKAGFTLGRTELVAGGDPTRTATRPNAEPAHARYPPSPAAAGSGDAGWSSRLRFEGGIEEPREEPSSITVTDADEAWSGAREPLVIGLRRAILLSSGCFVCSSCFHSVRNAASGSLEDAIRALRERVCIVTEMERPRNTEIQHAIRLHIVLLAIRGIWS